MYHNVVDTLWICESILDCQSNLLYALHTLSNIFFIKKKLSLKYFLNSEFTNSHLASSIYLIYIYKKRSTRPSHVHWTSINKKKSISNSNLHFSLLLFSPLLIHSTINSLVNFGFGFLSRWLIFVHIRYLWHNLLDIFVHLLFVVVGSSYLLIIRTKSSLFI